MKRGRAVSKLRVRSLGGSGGFPARTGEEGEIHRGAVRWGSEDLS